MIRFGRNYLLQKKLYNGLIQRGIITSPFPDVKIEERNYAEFILHHADKYKDHIAILDGIKGTEYRYSELVQLVKQVSSGFTKQKITKGDVVGIVMPNSPEYIFATYGIVATGATATFSNPASVPRELANQFSGSGTKIVVTSPHCLKNVQEAAKLAKCVQNIFVVGDTPSGCKSFNAEILEDNGSASTFGQVSVNAKEDIPYLPYSSGTTGLPKGVMLTHHNLISNLTQFLPCIKVNHGKEVFQLLLPLYHIYALAILGISLVTGSKAVTLPSFEPKSFLTSVQDHKVSFLNVVPPIILFMIHHPMVNDFDLSCVKQIYSAAASLDADTKKAIYDKLVKHQPEIDVLQAYGMTESGPVIFTLPPKERCQRKISDNSVGQLIPNMQCKILSADGNELGPNERGEIVVRGPNIMKGYFKNPDSTNQCIQDGWLHTGDVGYYDSHNYFYIVDRIKELIKYKGMQVAPAELEALLLTHPCVAACAVIGKPDEAAGEVPLAFIVKKSEVTETQIHHFVAERASDYKKLRGGIKFVESVPTSPSGKILRKDLRQLLADTS